MKFRFLAALVVFSFITPSASAAVKVTASKPAITAISPVGSGDQIFDISLSPTSVAVVGTVESGLANLVSAAPLGGSDGFISLFNNSKIKIWDLRLGTTDDDIATAVTRDKTGNFWVLGSTSKPSETAVTESLDPLVINLDGVSVEPVNSPKNSITRLVAWKMSPTGELSATYFYDSDALIIPTEVIVNASGFRVIGNLAKDSLSENFQIDLDLDGNFTNFLKIKPVVKKAPAITTIKAGPNNLKSFISKTTIIDIPSWRAKTPTPVIVKYTKKGKALAANSFVGKVNKILWQPEFGAAVLVDVKGELELHILKNMA